MPLLSRRYALWMLAAWLVVTVASLMLRAAIPLYPIFESPADDHLMVTAADALREGRWLGAWNVWTLSKGPGHPLSLSVAWRLGLPPTVFVQLLYLVGATLIAGFVFLQTRHRVLGVVVYVALALHPAMFGTSASRVYRESLVAGLALLAAGLALAVAVALSTRRRGMVPLLVLLTAGLGITLAWLSLTRVDLHWLPVFVVPVVVEGIVGRDGTLRAAAIRWGAVIAGVAAIVGGSRLAVTHMNRAHYGVELIDDFAGGAFAEACRSWAAVETGSPRKYVSIARPQREAVYAVSPSARRIRSFIEGDDADRWRHVSCRISAVCDDVSGAWFPWVLRDAAAAAGAAESAVAFQAFFSAVDAEIKAACTTGALRCGTPALGPGLPSAAGINVGATLLGLARIIHRGYLAGDAAELHTEYVPGAPEVVDLWRANVHGIPDVYGSLETPSTWLPLQIIAGLRAVASLAVGLLVLPALIGLLVSLWRPRAGERRLLIAGWAFVGAAVARAAILSIWADGSGAPAGENLYLLATIPFWVCGLAIGTWLFTARLARRAPG